MTEKTDDKIEEEFPNDFYPYDKEDVRQFYKQITNKIQEAYKIPELIPITFPNFSEPIDEVVIAGMGGSVIAGIVIKNYFKLINPNLRIIIGNDYHLPKLISKNALVICVSYSGNTEETLSMFKDAQRRKLRVMTVCSGGKLEEIANNYRVPIIKIPGKIHPRQALPYLFFTTIRVLEKLKFIDDHSKLIDSLIKVLNKKNFESLGIELAKKLYKKKIIIYSTKNLKGVAYRWKTQFNENSKVPAHLHWFPELCHNELCQYMEDMSDYHVIILKTDKEPRRMLKRIEVTKKLISRTCEVTELDIKGSNDFTKFYTAILIGDLASYYLALRYRRNPSDDSIIGELKRELGPWMS